MVVKVTLFKLCLLVGAAPSFYLQKLKWFLMLSEAHLRDALIFF